MIAKLKDISGCLSLLNETNEKHFNRKKFGLAIKNKNSIFLVTKEKGKVVGYVIGFVTPSDYTQAILQETRVSVKHRKKGIGTKLVVEFLKEAKKRKVTTIGAVVDEKDRIGIAFYNCLNFKKQGNWKWFEKKL